MPFFYGEYDDTDAKYERYQYSLKNKGDALPCEITHYIQSDKIKDRYMKRHTLWL